MDYIIILAVVGTFVYLLYRKHKKKPPETVSRETASKIPERRDAELLEVLEILVTKLEILIRRQEGKKDGTDGSA